MARRKTSVPYRRYGPDGVVSKVVFGGSRDRHKDDDDMFYSYTYGEASNKNKVDIYMSNSGTDSGQVSGTSDAAAQEEQQRQKGPVFPIEVFELIIKFSSYPSGVDLRLFLVCKSFYKICVKLLYEKPKLTSRNFNIFVDSMTTASIISYLSLEHLEEKNKALYKRSLKYAKTHYVRSLDLSNIVHAGRNSNITRIMRRCSTNLTEIIAPQTSFGFTSLNILKLCHNLTNLDLSLVSETVNLSDLFENISHLSNLHSLKFPRCSIKCDTCSFKWPQNLRSLKLSGGITNEFLMDSSFPHTLRELELQYCPAIKDMAVYYLLAKVGLKLTHFAVLYPMPRLSESSMDLVFKYCPSLISAHLDVDYISSWCFSEVHFPWILNGKFVPPLKGSSYNVLFRGAQCEEFLNICNENTICDDYSAEDTLAAERQSHKDDLIVSTMTSYFVDAEQDQEQSQSQSQSQSPTQGTEQSQITQSGSHSEQEDYAEMAGEEDTDSVLSQPAARARAIYPGLKSLRPLKSLYLGSSGSLGQANKIHPDDLTIALVEARLPNLSKVTISNRVGWNSESAEMDSFVGFFEDLNSGRVYMCP